MPTFSLGVLLAAGIASGAGAVRAARAARALYPDPLPLPAGEPSNPAVDHDLARPTAAALLDHAGTEVSDFLLPYELLASSRAFNVYAVGLERRPAVLTGGLDVVPHLGVADVASLPSDRLDLIVVPHLPDPDDQLIAWLREQSEAGALVLTICTGAGVAAQAGLLDGRTATTHWGDIGRLERRFPQVRWLRDVRYVDDGDIVASAGITSGIDATLHVIRRLAGAAAMHRAAEAVGYADLTYLDDPTAEAFRLAPADLVVALRAAFGRRHHLSVHLEDQVDEFALAADMDTFAATFTAHLLTVTADGRAVRTRHGLTVVPRASATPAPALPSSSVAGTPGPPYAAFHRALASLADLGGPAIARFAAKRLELRTPRPTNATTQTDHMRRTR